jgi:hypothetical protein
LPQSIRMLLVIYRVLSRRAWNRDTERQLTSLRWGVVSGGRGNGANSIQPDLQGSHSPRRSLVVITAPLVE